MHVLITGGSGLVGSRLTEILLERGFTVSHFSRKTTNQLGKPNIYHWDVEKGIIDEKVLLEADYIIHLAGSGIADKNWSEARKKEIIDSRVNSINLITSKLHLIPHRLKGFISASGIGYYGADTGDEHISEQHTAGLDFVADCCVKWEGAAQKIAKIGIRTVMLRTGIVLSNKGGALPRITQPVHWGLGAALGTGKQWQSWIHIDDLCEFYIKCMVNRALQGAFNVVAPNPVTNHELTETAAKVLKKPFWMPNVPAWALKLVFGEMASVVLGGNYILNQRIKLETDFRYKFPDLKQALENIL